MRWLLQALFGRRRRAVVFLDVDGVLNSRATRENGDHDPHPALVAELARLVNECHAHVVLSSTWRLETKNFERVSGALQESGISILDVTPDLESTCTGDRVDEIRTWLRTNAWRDVRAWIAIDDMDLIMMNPTGLRSSCFVRTSDEVCTCLAVVMLGKGRLASCRNPVFHLYGSLPVCCCRMG